MPLRDTKTAEAADKKGGMTLDELAGLVQAAMKAGASGSEVIEVTTVGLLRPRIRKATVHIAVSANSK